MDSTVFLGDRIRQIRRQRGMTQDQLAEAAGISARFVRQVEAGDSLPGTQTIFRIATALRTSPAQLLDKHEQLDKGGGDKGIPALRDALQDPGDLPGMRVGEEGTPAPLPELERSVRLGWEAYWAGQFSTLTMLLPGLIRAARASLADLGAAGCRPLAQSFQLAADLLVHTGNDDLAMAAARRAVRCAANGDDELQHATLAGTLSWILLHQGLLGKAEEVAAATADSIRPAGRVPMAHWTVFGALWLSAAAPAAAAGRGDAVAGYMEEAQIAALRFTEADRHDYQVSFGRSQLAMQQAHTATVLGAPDRALKAAGRVDRIDLLDISWGALNMDVAQACLDKKRTPAAVGALLTALDVSPEWARHQGQWRDLSIAVVRKAMRPSREVSRLRKAAGL